MDSKTFFRGRIAMACNRLEALNEGDLFILSRGVEWAPLIRKWCKLDFVVV